mgnify:CR=1 FL=1
MRVDGNVVSDAVKKELGGKNECCQQRDAGQRSQGLAR